MMPQMDGIEATKILRSMGYIHPIVALTANAVSGQASIFLENGFSDFISKPIDIRQMNVVLNKLIRDKQPPEVIESARQQAEAKKELSRNKQNQAIDPIFIEIFIRDAVKSLSVLGAVVKRITSLKKDSSCNVNDLRTFIIHTHGIKSALTYIGKMELAATALKLEQSGRDQKIDIIKAEAPAFISSLQALVKELSPSKNNVDDDAQDEDTEYLHESLLVIKSACKDYDEITANKAIVELREKTWSLQTKELLSLIAEHLLHSDFDEIIEAIDQFTKAG
jgi:CheY-like chemotaxis protein